MTIAGFLHTVPALAGTFDAMVAERTDAVDRLHLVEARLLRTAIVEGVTDAVRDRVAAHLRTLEADGADAILVTCSSIGEAAEAARSSVRIPIVRVDAAMARDAVRLAAAAVAGTTGKARVAVLATNTATLGPTTRLIEREAAAADAPIAVLASVVKGAVAARDADDPAEHDRLIAEAVEAESGTADVIVLAQASMAAAASSAETHIPILTSPNGGVADLLAALARAASKRTA
jgi:aspartate/glutamate racemase